jgi:hypothetical protein
MTVPEVTGLSLQLSEAKRASDLAGEVTIMMLTHRLVRLIETHSEALAGNLLERVQTCEFTRSYVKVPADELKQRVYEIYQHLGEWLLASDQTELERRYRKIGARRYHQHVPLSELIWAIFLTKENLWDYARWQLPPEGAVDLFAELEMLQLLDRFFGRATFYAAAGYEQAHMEAEVAIAAAPGSSRGGVR